MLFVVPVAAAIMAAACANDPGISAIYCGTNLCYPWQDGGGGSTVTNDAGAEHDAGPQCIVCEGYPYGVACKYYDGGPCECLEGLCESCCTMDGIVLCGYPPVKTYGLDAGLLQPCADGG